jgi:drug/metabolite transporter (DMT)-like permease
VIAAIRALPAESRGILLFMCGIFLFSLMDIIAKGLVQRYDPFQVVWARYASQTFWAFLLLSPKLRTLLRTRYMWMQILRSAFLFFATACFFTSLKFLLLAEVVAIFEVAPLMMTVLAYFVLKEKVGVRRWTGVGIGFIGAMIIIRPGGEVFTAVSILPIIGAACFAGYSIATRFLGREESPWTSFLYTALFGCVAASVIAPFYWTTPTLEDAAVMATFGIIGGVGHFALILAFTATSASIIAPFNYIGLVFATFWGFTIFAEAPDFWTVVGALVIVGAGLYVWRRERMRAA